MPRLYFAPNRDEQYCDAILCLSVCLSARISQRQHDKLHEMFCTCYLYMAVARLSSDDNAISYAVPVLWMTSCCP